MTRRLLRSVLELRARPAQLPSPRLSPFLASQTRSFNATTPIVDHVVPSHHINNAANPTKHLARPFAYKKSHPAAPPAPIDDSVRTLLPFLAAQPGQYVTVHIHGFPYLVQEGDQIRLPFRMPGVQPGDVLRLNRASVLGSRDYTLKGAPHIDERLFLCRAIVMGVEAEPMRIKIKKKRRQRRKRTVRSKHRFTLLKISELNVEDAESLE